MTQSSFPGNYFLKIVHFLFPGLPSQFDFYLLKLSIYIIDSSLFLTALYMLYCQLNLPHSNLCSRHALAQNPSMIHHCFTQLKSCCSMFLERFSKAHLQPTSPTLLSLPHRILSAYCAGIYTLCFHKCQNTVLPTFYSSKSHKLFQTFPDLVT